MVNNNPIFNFCCGYLVHINTSLSNEIGYVKEGVSKNCSICNHCQMILYLSDDWSCRSTFPTKIPFPPLAMESIIIFTFLPASLLWRFIKEIGFFGFLRLFRLSCASTKVLEKVTPKSTLSEQPDHWKQINIF